MPADYSEERRQLKLEAYRLSERMLEMEVSIATASDQRAIAFSGVLVAGSAILAGLFNPALPNYGLLIATAFLLLSAIFSGLAARPVKLYTPGAWFDDFKEDIEKNEPNYMASLEELAQFNDKHSQQNKEIIQKNAKLLNRSFYLAILGISIAILSQLYLSIC